MNDITKHDFIFSAFVAVYIGVTAIGGCTVSDGSDDNAAYSSDNKIRYVSADAEPTPNEDTSGNTASDGDTDADADTDADVDTDADADADSDADADGDTSWHPLSGENVQVSMDGNTVFSFYGSRGFQVTDISDRTNPRIIADVSLGGLVKDMYIVGKYAYFVIWMDKVESVSIEVLDISDLASPLRVSRTVLGRNVTSSIALQRGESGLLYVIRDGQLTSFNLTADGSVILKDSRKIEEGTVTTFQFADDMLAIVSYMNEERSTGDYCFPKCFPTVGDITLQLFDVSFGDGSFLQSTAIPLLSDGSLVSDGCLTIEDKIVTLVTDNGYVHTFDVTIFFQPFEVERSVIKTERSQTIFDHHDTEHCFFLGDRKFVATSDRQGHSYANSGAVTELAVDTKGRIEHRSSVMTIGSEDRLFSVLDGSALIGIGSSPEARGVVRLYDVGEDGTSIAVAAEHALDLQIVSSFVQADGVDTVVNETAPDGTPETGLLITQTEEGLQLFSFSRTTLTKRGYITLPKVVEGMMGMDALDENTLIVSESGRFSMVDVHTPQTPEVIAATSFAPYYIGFTTFGETGVRLNREGLLQVVPLDENVDRAEPSVVLSAGCAALLKLGDHLAVTHTIHDDTLILEVFDFETPTAPVSAAKIVDNAEGYYSYRVALSEGIAFLSDYGLQYLDLSDPQHSKFKDEIFLPVDEGSVSNLLAEKSTVYISYKAPVTIKGDNRPYAAHYYIAVDLTDPDAPKVSDAVNIPGVLTAINGTVLYTRDTVYESGSSVVSTVNRLTLDKGIAYLDASYTIGHATVTHMSTSEDRLLVTYKQATNGYVADTQNDLSVFSDDKEMSLLGGYTQEGELSFLAAAEDTALMMRSDGLFVLDIENPAQPKEQSYHPMSPDYFATTLIQGNVAYVLNNGRIFPVDLSK